MVATTRVGARRRRGSGTGGTVRDQLGATLVAGWRDWRRNPVMWGAVGGGSDRPRAVGQGDHPQGQNAGRASRGWPRFVAMLDPAHFHPAVMVPIAVASLATTLAGMFMILDGAVADRRVALAGMPGRRAHHLAGPGRPRGDPGHRRDTRGHHHRVRRPPVGRVRRREPGDRPHLWSARRLLGPLLGRVSGVFVAFLLPFVDLGIGQSPMLRSEPLAWAKLLPGTAACTCSSTEH